MKTSKGLRTTDLADELRKAKRLEPMHKSGKEIGRASCRERV